MGVKVYRTIKQGNLSTVVKGVRIAFQAATMNVHGVFSTDSAELQKAIEADSGYGTSFELAASPPPALSKRRGGEASRDDEGTMGTNGTVAEEAEEAPEAAKPKGRPKKVVSVEPSDATEQGQ
jgi:hypothetical protein